MNACLRTRDGRLGAGGGQGAHGADHEVGEELVLGGAVLGDVFAKVGDLVGGALGALEGARVGGRGGAGLDGGRADGADAGGGLGGRAHAEAGGVGEGGHRVNWTVQHLVTLWLVGVVDGKKVD